MKGPRRDKTGRDPQEEGARGSAARGLAVRIATGFLRGSIALWAALVLTPAVRAQDAPSAAPASSPLPVAVGDLVFTREGAVTTLRREEEALGFLRDPAAPVLELRRGLPAPALFEGQRWQPDRLLTVSADEIGQVFGLALRARRLRMDGKETLTADIFIAASASYGVALAEPDPEHPDRLRPALAGGADVVFAPGQWGRLAAAAGRGYGPGAIYLLDGATGTARHFAEVRPLGRPNGGAGLGNLAWDPRHRLLFVSDRESGLVLALDGRGREVDRFDHGVTGRPVADLPPVPLAPPAPGPHSPHFRPAVPSSWGLAPLPRRIWGLAVHRGRLYYGAAEGPSLWSVGLDPKTGRFLDDPRLEIVVLEAGPGAEIADIAFAPNGEVLLALRALPARIDPEGDLARPEEGRVLAYHPMRDDPARWDQTPRQIGVGRGGVAGDGGLALGPAIDWDGRPAVARCGERVIATGHRLPIVPQADTAPPLPLPAGVQLSPLRVSAPASLPPAATIVLPATGPVPPSERAGTMGDVALFAPCPANGGAALLLMCRAAGWGPVGGGAVTPSSSGPAGGTPGGTPGGGGSGDGILPLPFPLPPGGGGGGAVEPGAACLAAEPSVGCGENGVFLVDLGAAATAGLGADSIKVTSLTPGVSVVGGPVFPLPGGQIPLAGASPGQSVTLGLCGFDSTAAANGTPFTCCRRQITLSMPAICGGGSEGPGGTGGGAGQSGGDTACLAPQVQQLCRDADGVRITLDPGVDPALGADAVKVTSLAPGVQPVGGPTFPLSPAIFSLAGTTPGQTVQLALCAFPTAEAAAGTPFSCCRGRLDLAIDQEIPACPD